jgi:hypothetical protein
MLRSRRSATILFSLGLILFAVSLSALQPQKPPKPHPQKQGGNGNAEKGNCQSINSKAKDL